MIFYNFLNIFWKLLYLTATLKFWILCSLKVNFLPLEHVKLKYDSCDLTFVKIIHCSEPPLRFVAVAVVLKFGHSISLLTHTKQT